MPDRGRAWTFAVAAVSAPVILALAVTLWRSPFPITETIAFIEDAAARPAAQSLSPDTSFYRPLFYLTLAGIWHSGAALEARLGGIKLLTIVPVLVLLAGLIWHLRPRSALDASAATVALAVLIGSAGFRENLEIGIAQTIVGMPLALLVWMLLTREPGPWHTAAVIALTLVAIGFKEQGLVLLPLILVAWWTGAPGAPRGVAAAAVLIGSAYVLLRLGASSTWEVFEQDVGLGFADIDRFKAAERFGAFPYWMYAYNAASTIANVLFAEPTRGVFRIVHAAVEARLEPWHVIHLGSSLAVTALVAWWGARALMRVRTEGWSPDARLAVAMLVVLVVNGLLGFNYTRSRLGGMAVVLYAVAAYHAVRAVAVRACALRGPALVAAALALAVLAAAWQTRAVATVEWVRAHAQGNRLEWYERLPGRRVEFAHRAEYQHIMESMVAQGTDPGAPRATRFPTWIRRVLGE